VSFSVFLSVSSELKALRDTLHKVLTNAGVHALTQDQSLGAPARDVHDLLMRSVNDCDVVLHIAGDHYGANASDGGLLPFPNHPEFECSWTQFEYYYAHSLNKDVYAFVMSPGNTSEAKREGWTDDDLVRRKVLQTEHRERVISGKFANTPISNMPRTLNDSRSVADEKEMLSKLVGVVMQGQRDWGGCKDKILQQMGDFICKIEQLEKPLAEIKHSIDNSQATVSEGQASIEAKVSWIAEKTQLFGRKTTSHLKLLTWFAPFALVVAIVFQLQNAKDATRQMHNQQLDDIFALPSCDRLVSFMQNKNLDESVAKKAKAQLALWQNPAWEWQESQQQVCDSSLAEAKAAAESLCAKAQSDVNGRARKIALEETSEQCIFARCTVEAKSYVNPDCR
jgi:hypothetical protein